MIARRPGWISGAILMASLAAAALAATAPQVVGINAAVLNDVRIRGAGTAQARPAVLRQRVALADQVLTGQRSQLQVLLLDKSTFTVGANAQLTIDRYVYDPGGGRSFTASVAKGAFRFMSGRPDRGGGSAINTPVAAIGIRGTIIEGVVGEDAVAIASGEREINRSIGGDPATASLIILRGPGARTEGNLSSGAITVTAANRTVSLDRPMLAAYVPGPGMAPIGPFTISLAGLARVQALIFPSLAERLASELPTTPSPELPTRSSYPPGENGSFPPGFEQGEAPSSTPFGQGMPSLPQFPSGDGPSAQRPQSTTPSGTRGSQSSPSSTPSGQYPGRP
jgi:hypothetical protein